MAIEMRTRPDGRRFDELRPLTIEVGWNRYAEGSALISAGYTRVICTASVEEKVPPFRKGSGLGWVTAEYAMLPRATNTRGQRDGRQGRIDGRSQEIQRLVGRAMRAGVDLAALGERSVTIDCDVLQADGGTRTASITGGYVALVLALRKLGAVAAIDGQIAAVSVGIVDAIPLLDLDYSEDSHAEVDFNVVGTDKSTYVEVQGTAEGKPFDRAGMDRLLELADGGLQQLFRYQRTVLGLE